MFITYAVDFMVGGGGFEFAVTDREKLLDSHNFELTDLLVKEDPIKERSERFH